MIDPDAPSREAPTAGNLNHWLISDLEHSNTTGAPLVKTADAVVPYAGPSVRKEGHRYIFLLYRQEDGKMKPSEEQKLLKRPEKVEGRWASFAALR